MKLKINKKGFTLVEVLIVMLLIGLLSTLAVNGYTQYRTATLFGLAIDNLASKIYEMRSKAMYGEGAGNSFENIKTVLQGGEAEFTRDDVKCYGVYFTSDSGANIEARYFVQKFESKKVWNAGKWIYRGCGNVPVESDFLPQENVDEQFFMNNISLNGVDKNSLMIRFAPPNGAFEVFTDADERFDASSLHDLKFKVAYGVADSLNRKVVDFDLVRSSYNTSNEENNAQ